MAYRLAGLCPEGSVVAWDKSLGTNKTPALTSEWFEANGQTCTNTQSIWYNLAIPNLNGATVGGITPSRRFLRGATIMGEGNADTHTHIRKSCQTNVPPYNNLVPAGCWIDNSFKVDANFEPPFMDMVYIFAIMRAKVPVGGHVWLLKSLTNCPALPDEYVEDNNQSLSDSQSVYDGVTMRNINGTTEATKLFIRGNSTSGGTGGALTHTHVRGAAGHYVIGLSEAQICPTYLVTTENHLPKFEEAVSVMRIK